MYLARLICSVALRRGRLCLLSQVDMYLARLICSAAQGAPPQGCPSWMPAPCKNGRPLFVVFARSEGRPYLSAAPPPGKRLCPPQCGSAVLKPSRGTSCRSCCCAHLHLHSATATENPKQEKEEINKNKNGAQHLFLLVVVSFYTL